MKKILKAFVLLLFTLISTSIFAQLDYDKWEVVETVDDFGDPTGESVARYFSKGTFSNSATTGEDMIVKLVDYGIKDDGSGQSLPSFISFAIKIVMKGTQSCEAPRIKDFRAIALAS